MTIPNFRSSEALYIIIVRAKNAEQLLKDWARQANVQVTVEQNRMKLFENRSISLFRMQWQHSWDDVIIWDCWLKRHINLE
jgi:hypothetical protein